MVTRDRRLRIEHADLTEEADIARFAKLSVTVVMQPAFCCAEQGMNYDLDNPLPSDRWKTFENSGATLAFSSDWPCTWPPDPFVGVQEAVTRQVWRSQDTADIAVIRSMERHREAPSGPARPTCRKRSSVWKMPSGPTLRALPLPPFQMTGGHSRSRKGSGSRGAVAGSLCSRPAIAQTRVVMTMVAGKVVYSASPPPSRGSAAESLPHLPPH